MGPAVSRRAFLATLAGVGAALTLDPERLLWVPGAKTFFLPSTTLVEAATMADALRLGLVAVFPDGARLEVQLAAGDGMTLDARMAREHAAVRQMGGRIVHNRQWRETTGCR